MVAHRLDVAFRVADTTEDLKCNYNAGGDTSLTLTAGLYQSLAALCAEIQTQLQTVDVSLTCSESSGTVTIAGTLNFSITWDHRTLRDWLGFTLDLSGSNTYSGTSVCAGTFVSTLPWEDLGLGWMWTTKRWESHHQTGGSVKLGKVRLWRVSSRMTKSELDDQFRSVMRYMLQGKAARWWRNTADNTAWSYTNWDGFVDVVLDGETRSYSEQWLSGDGILIDAMVPLGFVVYA